MTRRETLLGGLDVARLRGAEIGALASPIVSRTDGAILYIDHDTTQALKAKYADHAGVDVDAIVEVDAVWGERTIAEALGAAAPLDYIVASHVIEHVPDLIGWLGELASVLEPGGQVRLAVPDKRYCFDYLREETRLSDVLAAHFTRARRPLAREVIDSELHHRPMNAADAWAGAAPGPEILTGADLARALAMAERAGQTYVDVHCWAFTPSSFAALMSRLSQLDLQPFACADLHPTEPNSLEFFAGLKLEPDRQSAMASWRRAEADNPRGTDRRALDHLAGELAHARSEVERIRASTSWRLTAPLRAVASRLRPR